MMVEDMRKKRKETKKESAVLDKSELPEKLV